MLRGKPTLRDLYDIPGLRAEWIKIIAPGSLLIEELYSTEKGWVLPKLIVKSPLKVTFANSVVIMVGTLGWPARTCPEEDRGAIQG